jgi:hypothetical protein
VGNLLADIVLALHLAIAAFITAGLILIPLGGLMGWAWVRYRRFRFLHAGLMVFVATEALLGIACPLTVLESALRQQEAPDYFLADLMHRLLYWDAPLELFLALYVLCALWVLVLWKWIPPQGTKLSENSAVARY